jgi:hypothetical protein
LAGNAVWEALIGRGQRAKDRTYEIRATNQSGHKRNKIMATEVGKEAPSFAVIEDMHANRPAAFEKAVRGLVSMQDRVTTSRKEVTNTVNFLAQGKFVSLAMKDYQAAPESKAFPSCTFASYFRARFGGRIPGAGLTIARAFDAFCLAPKTAARYVPESVFDGCYCRVLQAAGKIVNIASFIKGPTLQTSYLGHQVFTDVAAVLNMHGCDAVKELREIEARLVEVETTDGEDKIKTLVYLSVEELAKCRAIGISRNDTGG